MKSKRQLYRQVFQYEILSEEPIPDCMSLSEIEYQTQEGHMSGRFLETVVDEAVDGPTMAKLLVEQGSDPDFFGLDQNGDDSEEYRDDNYSHLLTDDECPVCKNGTVERTDHINYEEVVCRGECGNVLWRGED